MSDDFRGAVPRYKRKRVWVFLSDVQTKETPTRVFFYIFLISFIHLPSLTH